MSNTPEAARIDLTADTPFPVCLTLNNREELAEFVRANAPETTERASAGVDADAIYQAWHAVGADVAGLDWGKFISALTAHEAPAATPTLGQVTEGMVNRFLWWPLPKTFSPDCGVSFDGRKDDEWNKDKTWPVGTNLFSADEARQMLEHILEGQR